MIKSNGNCPMFTLLDLTNLNGTECPKLQSCIFICMDTQIGKFFNTSHTQVFDFFFGRVFDNDT